MSPDTCAGSADEMRQRFGFSRRREDDSGRFGGDVPFYFDATFFQPGQRIACVRRA